MRHGRAKAARKTLQYFGRTVGLKAPYHILLDGTLVVAMFHQKILPFIERMDRVLQTTTGGNKYCITKGAVDELEKIYNSLKEQNHSKQVAFESALEWIQKECFILNPKVTTVDTTEQEQDQEENEEANDKSVQKELLDHVHTDEKPYIVATQDEGLLDVLRNMGTVPIVRLANDSVLILENPSKQSQRQFKGKEHKKWKHCLQESEQQLVKLVRKQKKKAAQEESTQNNPNNTVQRTKSKAKGPNPLSCKRKQQGNSDKKESASKKRRQRAKKQKTDA